MTWLENSPVMRVLTAVATATGAALGVYGMYALFSPHSPADDIELCELSHPSQFMDCIQRNVGRVIYFRYVDIGEDEYDNSNCFDDDFVNDGTLRRYDIPVSDTECYRVELMGNYYNDANSCGTSCYWIVTENFILVSGPYSQYRISSWVYKLEHFSDVPLEVRQKFKN